MPPRHQFYDPFVENGAPTVSDMSHTEQRTVRGFTVEVPGVYLHVDDVASTLRAWAAEPGYEALNDAADVFAGMGGGAPPAEDQPAADPHPEVARIEIFPDSDGKWHARPVSSDGSILATTDGSFDRLYVEVDANERWPGKELFELADAMGDSIWDEQDHSFGFNGRRRPSPRRLWS